MGLKFLPGGKANMASENQDPYDQAFWGNCEREERKIEIPVSL